MSNGIVRTGFRVLGSKPRSSTVGLFWAVVSLETLAWDVCWHELTYLNIEVFDTCLEGNLFRVGVMTCQEILDLISHGLYGRMCNGRL